MIQPLATNVHEPSAQDLLDRFGPIPLSRVCYHAPPGRATKQDVQWLQEHADTACELVDGILVRKAMGAYESQLGLLIGTLINLYVLPRQLGAVLGEHGLLEIMPDLVRIPDVCFISRQKAAGRLKPSDPIPALVPDLAVEVLSRSNTAVEMSEKLQDYFTAGVRLVWFLEPELYSLTAYTAVSDSRKYRRYEKVPAEPVIPGFALDLDLLFKLAEGQAPTSDHPLPS